MVKVKLRYKGGGKVFEEFFEDNSFLVARKKAMDRGHQLKLSCFDILKINEGKQ